MTTFHDVLKRSIQIASGRTALINGDESFTYTDLYDRCSRLVGGLKAIGCEKGERVAILADNSHQYIETYVGVPSGGMVVVPMNTRHAIAELKYALEDSGAKVLITDREDTGGLEELVDRVIRLPDDYEKLLAEATPAALGVDLSESDLAGLFYTGGTTGASKGVMLSHRNLIANTHNWMSIVLHEDDTRTMIMAPLFHAAGSNGVLGGIWAGTLQVTLGAFAPGAALDLIEKHKINLTLGVPTMLAAIAEEQAVNPRDTSTIRLVAHGGSPIASEIVRRTGQAFPNAQLMEVYGATELSPLATVLPHEETLLDSDLIRSCGRPIYGNVVDILDPEGNPLPCGEIGEVVVTGTNVMIGYWNKPEQTDAVLKNGSYWSGDLGYMDDEGFVFLVDRSKDMIVSGGENVYCTEVEEVLYKHEAVLEAAVFGVPDDKWGEAVHAVVVPREEHNNIDPKELIDFCHERIAGYKTPKGITLQNDPLPKSGPGKVLKRELRAPFWEDSDRNIS